MAVDRRPMNPRERVMLLIGLLVCVPAAWWALAGKALLGRVETMEVSVAELERTVVSEQGALVAVATEAEDLPDGGMADATLQNSRAQLGEAVETLASLRGRFAASSQELSARLSELAAANGIQVLSVSPAEPLAPESGPLARRLRGESGYGRSAQRLVLLARTLELRGFLDGLGGLPARATVLRMQMRRDPLRPADGRLEVTLDVSL